MTIYQEKGGLEAAHRVLFFAANSTDLICNIVDVLYCILTSEKAVDDFVTIGGAVAIGHALQTCID